MYDGIEKEFDLKDILYRVAQKWRRIIVGAVIVALLAVLFQIVSGVRLILDEEAFAEAQRKFDISMNDYLATGERLKTRIKNLQDQSEKQQEYNDKSHIMKIDPMNKWVGNLQIYIDSKYQIDPSLTYQNTDLTSRLISAYASYLQSGELYAEILANNTADINEIRFLTEVYSVSVSSEAATISVNCAGVSEEEVSDLLALVKGLVAVRYGLIQSTIGEHSYDILTESVYATIDLSLDEKQKSNILAIAEYANLIGETNELLSEWEDKKPPEMEFGVPYIIKRTVIFGVIGGLIGIVLVVGWYVLSYIVKRTIKTDADWNLYGVPVLGRIYQDTENKHFRIIDCWIDRIFDHQYEKSTVKWCTLVAHNLEPMLKEHDLKAVAFVSVMSGTGGKLLTQKIAESTKEVDISYAGDILRDPSAAKTMEQLDEVILLGEMQETRDEDLERTLTLLRAWGKNVLGTVAIE